MKLNLSLTPNETQRCASGGSQTKAMPDAFGRTQSRKPARIAVPAMPRLVLRGDRHFLRALRAAEMDAWLAGRPFVAGQFHVG